MTDGPERLVDVVDRLQDALAAEALLVAVAQLDRLVLAGRRAARHGGAPAPGGGLDFDFDRGVAARIEDLAGEDGVDFAHGRASSTEGCRARGTAG